MFLRTLCNFFALRTTLGHQPSTNSTNRSIWQVWHATDRTSTMPCNRGILALFIFFMFSKRIGVEFNVLEQFVCTWWCKTVNCIRFPVPSPQGHSYLPVCCLSHYLSTQSIDISQLMTFRCEASPCLSLFVPDVFINDRGRQSVQILINLHVSVLVLPCRNGTFLIHL